MLKKPVNIFTDDLNENVFIFNRYYIIASYNRSRDIITKNTVGYIEEKEFLYDNYVKVDNTWFIWIPNLAWLSSQKYVFNRRLKIFIIFFIENGEITKKEV